METKLSPFLKWVGGKTQLLEKIKESLPYKYRTYYEPFVGGGAVFFGLCPKIAVINDKNSALMNAYRQIRDNPKDIIELVNKFDSDIGKCGKEYYYEARDKFNQKLSCCIYDIECASLFIFINKHCFNGLYRVNNHGLFNVPYNNASNIRSINENNIMNISAYLQNVDIREGDFEDSLSDVSESDFVFIDSPYIPISDTSFISYTKDGFSIEDHIRLSSLIDDLTYKGVYVMCTNHNSDAIKSLYANKGYLVEEVSVKRFINSDASNRIGEEIIIRNYE